MMENPESQKYETRGRSMGGGEAEQKPSTSRPDGQGKKVEGGQEGELQRQAYDVQGVEKNPLEIESVDSSRAGVSSSRNNVDTNLNKAAGMPSSSKDVVSDAGPSSPKVGTAVEAGKDEDDSNYRLNERSSGAEGGGEAGIEKNFHEGDPPRQQQEGNDPSLLEGGTAPAEETAAADTTPVQQFRSTSASFGFPPRFPPLTDKSGDAHFIDIPLRTSSKVEELEGFKRFGIARTLSNFSRASAESAAGDQCRICQQHTEEPLMELGCQCRGELARAHLSCVNHWFGNKGTNKCEVCQNVATNVPLPASQPTPHFWVWRVGGPYNPTARRGQGARFHPLWAALLILIAGLLFDILISIFLGASALPVNIIIGVLVVLGLGTAARLVLECWHERVIRRNIRRMEEEPNLEDFLEENHSNIQMDPLDVEESSVVPPPSPGPAVQGSAEAAVTASVAATATPDVLNR